ncbi:protein phosphatase 1 regulatory subunit 12C [Ischnura elegans]|uniref:protein phosphatase 1 regulatory subunit 12C n=1 Tax=Ischnura elegans TaxID=197161 RepID=UPI001ED8AFA8|nr:protein phosphatase 1 regulatory subunit 12C [Ischnura elegans]
MSLETRSTSALFKRAEQLRRWEESETNKEAGVSRNKERRVKFSSGCVFLAACGAGDKEEVERLLQKGADIDTTNVDGLTALHQACIDDNLEMVEFLVEHGADVNRGDNEGWTPLHATASCGFISIAKFLIENGANVASVNNDGHLPLDIAESDEMEEMLNEQVFAKGIDCEEARNEEERLMMLDAMEWLNSGGEEARHEVPHPKTGATALHVAAAKGYIKVMRLLIQAGCDVDAQDFDGWTPLHAAAHWCVNEACELIVEDGLCDMDIKNYVGQTAFDVADPNLNPSLEELRKRQAGLLGSKRRKKKEQPETKVVSLVPTSPTGEPEEESIPNDASHKHRTTKGQELENNRISTNRGSHSIEGEGVKDTQVDSEEGGSGDSLQRLRRTQPNEDGAAHVDDEDVLIDESEGRTGDGVVCVEEKVKEGEEEEEENSSSSSAASSSSPSSPSSSSPSTSSSSESSDSSDECEESGIAEKNLSIEEKKNRVNREDVPSTPGKNAITINAHHQPAPASPPKVVPAENEESAGSGSGPSWRRPGSFRSTGNTATRTNSTPSRDDVGTKKAATNRTITNDSQQQDVILRRTHSFESDEKFYARYRELQERIKATSSCPTLLHSSPNINLPTRSASLRERQLSSRKGGKEDLRVKIGKSDAVANSTSNTTNSMSSSPTSTSPLPGSQVRSSAPVTPSTPPTTPGGSRLSPGNFLKNFFKSFVPPVRDEESETQRKAHAKRVRETRRSTQGVTLEELKSAEQLVRKQQQQQAQQLNDTSATPQNNQSNQSETPATQPQEGDAGTTAGPQAERRPSWRLRVDNGDRNKFLLEDARTRSGGDAISTTSSTLSYIRRPTSTPSSTQSSNTPSSTTRPSSVPMEADTTVTIALRRQSKPPDNDKDQDKENDSRNAQATQAVIQRRRRPKRRSTGVVHVDMDEIDPDRQESAGDGEDNSKYNSEESGAERSGRSSRLGSTSSLSGDRGVGDYANNSRPETPSHSENGEVPLNYKKLWEESQAENERLRERLRKAEEELKETRSQLQDVASTQNNINAAPSVSKSALSEVEKRERRALERKLSEMEEELKQLEQLRCENQRLKEENGALIRVISKLSK